MVLIQVHQKSSIKQIYLIVRERFLPFRPCRSSLVDDEDPPLGAVIAVLPDDTFEAGALAGHGIASSADGKLSVATAALAACHFLKG
jgi:hypothetical protein